MNKITSTFLAAILIVASTPALPTIVGGVDFGVLGENPSNTHLETATLAQMFINSNGQGAMAYGFITTVNGDNTYCADGTGNCGLYYVANFNGLQNFSPSYVEFTGATVSVFFSNTSPINLLGQDSPTNIATIQALNGGTPWVTLTGHNNLGGRADPSAVLNGGGILSGSTLGGASFGLLDVTGPGDASVISFLNSNRVLDAAGSPTDMVLTNSFNNFVLNPLDITNGLAAGCLDGTASAGAWCLQGTLDLRGGTVAAVPEPSRLMLMLIGMGFLGFAARRKKQQDAV